MVEQEGVIKYRLDFEKAEPVTENLQCLNVWRSLLHRLGLIGQQPDRYQGYGFGNLSMRSSRKDCQFIISASQTGHLADLEQRHYVCVQHCDIDSNRVQACGPRKPSSEALTHAMFYQLNPAIGCVIHVHSPSLWNFGLRNAYPATAENIEYGTPAMAEQIARLYRNGELSETHTLMMAGHEDGVICFGDSIEQAGLALVSLWVNSGR